MLPYAGYRITEAQETSVLVIEDLQAARILWQWPVKEGGEVHYEYVHSVYLDKVYSIYRISPGGEFILEKVASSPAVLFSFSPGFGLSLASGKRSGDLVEVEINKLQKELVIAVGDEMTDKTFTVGEQSVILRQIAGHGSGVRIYVRKSI